MNYQLLVTDIDDTLLTTDKRISKKNKDALMAAQEQGVAVAIASGRLPIGVKPFVEALGLPDRGGYYLSFNGGLILDAQDHIIHSSVLERRWLDEVYTALRPYDVAVLVHQHDKIFTDNRQNSYSYTEPEALHQPLHLLDNLLTDVSWDLHKILIAGEPELLKEIEPVLKAQFSEELDIFLSAPWFLDVMPKGVNKGVGIRWLAERMGIPIDRVIACGDSYNDLSMIQEAGLGVAVQNAEPDLKAAADYVTERDCDHDAIAEVIEKFILA